MFADLTHPCGAIHYQIKSHESVQVLVTARMDLRHMWPLSERATGSLKFAWDKGLHAGIATNVNGDTSSVLGSSLRPEKWLIGQFSEVFWRPIVFWDARLMKLLSLWTVCYRRSQIASMYIRIRWIRPKPGRINKGISIDHPAAPDRRCAGNQRISEMSRSPPRKL